MFTHRRVWNCGGNSEPFVRPFTPFEHLALRVVALLGHSAVLLPPLLEHAHIDGETLVQGFRVTDYSKSDFVEKDKDVFYVGYTDIVAVLETPELKRTIGYRFSPRQSEFQGDVGHFFG